MKTMIAVLSLALCATATAQSAVPGAPQPNDDDVLIAQGVPAPGPMQPGPGRGRFEGRERGPRGPMKFWNDSEVATKLNLTDQQKQQLETTFTNYKLKLIDQRAAVQREEVKLEPLIQADKLDEGAITKQIDALIAARGNLERTVAMMGLDIRKVLTTDQWKQLKQMRGGMMGMGGMAGPGPRNDRRRNFRQRRMPPPDGGQQGPGAQQQPPQ